MYWLLALVEKCYDHLRDQFPAFHLAQSLGFRVSDFGFRVWGLVFRVWGLVSKF